MTQNRFQRMGNSTKTVDVTDSLMAGEGRSRQIGWRESDKKGGEQTRGPLHVVRYHVREKRHRYVERKPAEEDED